MRKYLGVIALIFCFVSSCKKDEYEAIRVLKGPEYFNMKPGTSAIYSVFEVLYDDFTNTTDTNIYQLREHNESVFTDLRGRNAMRIDRYRRNRDSTDWVYLNTWYSAADLHAVERIEDNKRYIKLSFPLNPEVVWDANAQNAEGSSNVYYGLIGQSFQLDTMRYPDVISVESNSVKNASKERAFREVYARDIGLVYKNYVYIDTDITGKLRRGIRQNIKLIAYEK